MSGNLRNCEQTHAIEYRVGLPLPSWPDIATNKLTVCPAISSTLNHNFVKTSKHVGQ